MVRTKDVGEEKKLFKKFGGGSLRIGNKIIKPGETFWELPSKISPAFKDVVRLTDGGTMPPPPPEKKQPEGKKAVFIKQRRGVSNLWWDIVNTETGKVMNEKALKAESADKLLEELNR